MAPSVTSTGILESGPVHPAMSARRRRQVVAVGTALAAGVGVAVTSGTDGPSSPPAAYVESWIDAWNDRDAQAISSMTCLYIPAFVPAGIIENFLYDAPAGRPVVDDPTITGSEPGIAYGREGVWVHVRYVPARAPGAREKDVFVRVRDTGDMCIGQPTIW
jgi:hypothetical protein